MLAVGKIFLSSGDVAVTLLDHAVELVDMLFGKFNLQRLEFHLLREKVKLTVVLDIVKLLLITSYFILRIIDFFFLGSKFLLELGNLVL